MEKVTGEEKYKEIMKRVDSLMAKGSERVSKKELVEIRELAVSLQDYEQKKYVIDPPSTLAGMIEMRMFEMRLKQKDVAKKLRISDAKLSLIMNGKQKPDVDFLKAVHTELKVDAEFILRHT
ncbi:helix-turn-helix domain-containing protein [Daejeonella sp.]|uniref:helix-turn-helix domain-containing protein n=1 Tax=Daejeonella sp. TaxID=2805397 RepID=UPI0030BEA0A7